MNGGQLGSLKRSLGNLFNKAGNFRRMFSKDTTVGEMNRKGFVHKLCLTVGFKRMFSPRKEHQCLTWKLNTHTHTKASFCPHWALLNSRKVCHAWKYVSLPLSQSKCYRETKIPYLLSLGKWIVRVVLQKDHQKIKLILQNEFWEFGLWNESQGPLFLTLGRHLSSLYLYSSI